MEETNINYNVFKDSDFINLLKSMEKGLFPIDSKSIGGLDLKALLEKQHIFKNPLILNTISPVQLNLSPDNIKNMVMVLKYILMSLIVNHKIEENPLNNSDLLTTRVYLGPVNKTIEGIVLLSVSKYVTIEYRDLLKGLNIDTQNLKESILILSTLINKNFALEENINIVVSMFHNLFGSIGVQYRLNTLQNDYLDYINYHDDKEILGELMSNSRTEYDLMVELSFDENFEYLDLPPNIILEPM